MKSFPLPSSGEANTSQGSSRAALTEGGPLAPGPFCFLAQQWNFFLRVAAAAPNSSDYSHDAFGSRASFFESPKTEWELLINSEIVKGQSFRVSGPY